MKRLRNLLVICIFTLSTFLFFGCEVEERSNADKQQQQHTEIAMQEANRQVGMPNIVNFQEKKMLKWIYELCDQEDYICHAYLVNTITGEVGQYLGKCVGYGIPYSAQFSNPEKVVNGRRMLGYKYSSEGSSIMTLKQSEPNGIFKPEGLSATWLIMLDPETNEPRPIYCEPEIIVSPFKLK